LSGATEAYEEYQQSGGGSFVKWDTKGTVVEGIFTAIEESTKYQGTHIGTVLTPEGNARFGINKALKDRLAPVKFGYRVRIEYTGDRKSKSGQNYHDFDVKYAAPKADKVPF
jgi:hypothetical protein